MSHKYIAPVIIGPVQTSMQISDIFMQAKCCGKYLSTTDTHACFPQQAPPESPSYTAPQDRWKGPCPTGWKWKLLWHIGAQSCEAQDSGCMLASPVGLDGAEWRWETAHTSAAPEGWNKHYFNKKDGIYFSLLFILAPKHRTYLVDGSLLLFWWSVQSGAVDYSLLHLWHEKNIFLIRRASFLVHSFIPWLLHWSLREAHG